MRTRRTFLLLAFTAMMCLGLMTMASAAETKMPFELSCSFDYENRIVPEEPISLCFEFDGQLNLVSEIRAYRVIDTETVLTIKNCGENGDYRLAVMINPYILDSDGVYKTPEPGGAVWTGDCFGGVLRDAEPLYLYAGESCEFFGRDLLRNYEAAGKMYPQGTIITLWIIQVLPNGEEKSSGFVFMVDDDMAAEIADAQQPSGEPENVIGGECGAQGGNITWTLDLDSGHMEISGEGEMADWDADWQDAAPWREYADTIKTVVIEEGITSIGHKAFDLCGDLVSVEIPDSVTKIGKSAFEACGSLRKIRLPLYLESLGRSAFGGSGLEEIILPPSVRFERDAHFDDCYDLTNVVLGRGIAEITERMFDESGVINISVPEGVTKIYHYAFFDCFDLTTLSLPASLTWINMWGTFPESLTDVYYAGSEADWRAIARENEDEEDTALDDATIHFNHVHSWDKGTVDVAPTCLKIGRVVYTCSVCGGKEADTLLALGHDKVDDPAVAPTCTEIGLTEGSHCARCGEVFVAQNVLPALGHVEIVDAAVAASCTETGLTEGKHCERCKETLIAQKTVPALGHAEIIDKAIAATCTAAGKTEGKHCSRCETVLVAQREVPALGHDPVTDPAVAPTCTEEGKTEGSHCARCGEVLVEQNAVSPLEHTVVVDPGVAPLCAATGLSDGSHCGVCGTILKAQEIIPAIGHIPMTDAAVPPTCTDEGLGEGTHCAACGTTIIAQQMIPPVGHKYDDELDKWCNVCGAARKVIVSGRVNVNVMENVAVSVVVNGETKEVSLNEDGSFVLEAEENPFDLVVKKGGCLTYTIKDITVAGSDIDLGTITLLAGDTNGDGMINIVDMGIFRQNFGKMGAAIGNAHTDTNADNMVNIIDMSVFRTNFGKTAANDCTVKYGA